MSASKPNDSITLENRRAIFLSVVESQDRGVPVAKARIEVAQLFGIAENDVKAIEQEGLDNQWPPL
jgi:hypothetical protein